MKVVACYKCVPNAESVRINADRSIDLSAAEWEIGQYDLCAVEEASHIAAGSGGKAIAMTAGGEIASGSKMKKSVLSRGMDEAVVVQNAALESADCFTTAKVLSAAIKKLGDVDLVLCGEGSGDSYSQQTGNMLGAVLGWSTVNAVSKLELLSNTVRAERSLEDRTEVLEIALPAVISVSSNINSPRIPSMRDILGAGKKPSAVWSLDDICADAEASSEIVSIVAPVRTERMRNIYDGSSEDGIDEFVGQLRKAL